MKKFNYQARDQATNKVIKAFVQAESEKAAAKLLVNQGFMPLDISEVNESSGILGQFKNRVGAKDRIVFTRQLATLISAGLPLSQSLNTILDQTENPRLKRVVEDIIASVEGGRTLHESFSNHPDVFDKVFLALVAAGETSGTLDDALRRIAAQQEKDAEVMSKIKGAMTYPIIVLFVIFGVMAFMLFTVVPQVEKLYIDMKKGLPFVTQVMVSTTGIIMHYWWAIIIALIAVIYFGRQYLSTESGVKTADIIKLNIPIFGPVFRKLYMARFTRTGQTLLSTGVPMLDMLQITSQAVNNTRVADSLIRASDKVKGGKALSEALAPEEYVLPLVPQMIKIGEQSGKIDEMMGKTAQVYEEEIDEYIRTISTAIEPVLMVFLAIIAGTMIAAILFPIYSLVSGV